MTDPADSDRRIDELFTLAPEKFTAARNSLVRDLRGAGERDLAAAVAKLRRPTVGAWAINQTVRAHRRDFDELIDTGDQVRREQRRALSGVRASGMRDATRARRSQIEQLAQLATDFLVERGIAADSHRGDIVATFDAASADEDAAATVGRARLSQMLPVSSSFGALEGLTVFAADADAEAAPEKASVDGDDRRERAAVARRTAMRAVADARRRLTDAQATAARAAAEATRAAARAAGAEQTAQVAEDTARRLRAEADELAARADQARARSADTDREAKALGDELRAQEHELQALEE